jgi:hypothetical protein
MPRSVSFAAIARKLSPSARSASIIGLTRAAKASAFGFYNGADRMGNCRFSVGPLRRSTWSTGHWSAHPADGSRRART